MRIFVAGASGVLGRAFVRRAVCSGHEVIGMTRSARGAATIRSLAAAAVRADAFDREAIMRAVAEAHPDAVVHLLTDLASGDSASNAHIRTVGTRNLIEATRAAGVDRVVAESISWVYPPGTTPASEAEALDADATEPRLTTIRGVAALEASVREMPDGVVLRFGQLYGPGTWYAPDGLRADAARAGRLPATETVTSFVHVEDAAEATLRALRWPAGIWNIVDDEPAAGTAWVPAFASAVGAPRPVVEVGGDIGRPVSNARARTQGWEMLHTSWRDGFAAQ
jgi:nucleoside-diphosphate-sugar epimerase